MSRILANIDFFPTDEGGRGSPLPKGRVGYVLETGGQNFSCWILNTGAEAIEPGDTAQVEVVLAAPELALPLLKKGSSFVLKDYREIARGVVESVQT